VPLSAFAGAARYDLSLGSLPKVEQALLRLLAADDPVPLSLLHWVITGTWPPEAMQPRCDVSFLKQSRPGAMPT
jgi:hypothetical protein